MEEMMNTENIPAFEEVYSAEEQIDLYIGNRDYPSLLKAASIMASVQGDRELSETLSLLSAQLDFSDDDYDDAAITKTRTKLAKIIRDRRPRMHMSYHSLMTDDDALRLFKGEVTNSEGLDDVTGTITENGLFDPALFGGSGVIAEIGPDGKSPVNVTYGTRMAHITLPGRFLVPGFAMEASVLLKIPEEKVRGLVYYSLHLVTQSDDDAVPAGSIITEKELADALNGGAHVKTEMGAGALEHLLLELGLPDHPEKMVFSVLPVVSPRIRPVFFVRECARYRCACALNDLYRGILYRCSRIRRLEELGVPDIIMRNEKRMLQEYIDALWHGRKDADGENEADGLSRMLITFRKRGLRTGCRELVSAQRRLLGGWRGTGSTAPASEIRDPGFFPETVVLVSGDGAEESPVSYRTVIDTNNDRAFDLVCDGMPDDGDGEESTPSQDGLMSSDDIYAETDRIRIACAHGEKCRVRFDAGNDVYVMVPPAA